MKKEPIIEVHDLTVSYDKKPVLWDVDFTIPKGVICGVLGPNGSGKSTLLKSIMGLLSLDSGSVKLFGTDLKNIRRKVAYVPQRESVDWDFPASVLDVVLMGLYAHKSIFQRISKADKDWAMHCLEKVKMESFASRQISQLSGGQQQRVFIARALAQKPELFLMDEPFAGVDATTEKSIMDLLRNMKEEGKTILVVHHDLQTVNNYFDWLVFMNTRLVASGKMEDVFQKEILEETYGGQLSILSQVLHVLKQKEIGRKEHH
ncbi:MAG: metal ABC transporter ATP-binding protein [Flavobacteriales bacterium]|jgi:manganese/zinc/iron transport system ATP- binding protein|nr:metal ABC transporter ATP-binding protein [Flavobacteriales bacterium]